MDGRVGKRPQSRPAEDFSTKKTNDGNKKADKPDALDLLLGSVRATLEARTDGLKKFKKTLARCGKTRHNRFCQAMWCRFLLQIHWRKYSHRALLAICKKPLRGAFYFSGPRLMLAAVFGGENLSSRQAARPGCSPHGATHTLFLIVRRAGRPGLFVVWPARVERSNEATKKRRNLTPSAKSTHKAAKRTPSGKLEQQCQQPTDGQGVSS